MKYKTKARNYVAKHIGSLLFAVFRYSVKLYIWSIMHFHINILIIVSEIFSEEWNKITADYNNIISEFTVYLSVLMKKPEQKQLIIF